MPHPFIGCEAPPTKKGSVSPIHGRLRRKPLGDRTCGDRASCAGYLKIINKWYYLNKIEK